MHSWTQDDVSGIMEQVRTWFPTVVLVSAVYAGLTALFSFLLIIGVSCEVSSSITLSQNGLKSQKGLIVHSKGYKQS